MVAYTFYESDNRVRRYAETLARQGFEVDVVALRREGNYQKVEIINGVRLLRVQLRVVNEKSRMVLLRRLLLFFLRSMWVLSRQQLKQRYDLVHIHSIPDFEVFAALLPKITGSKLILDIHDIVPEYYASKFQISSGSLIFKLLVLVERMSAVFSDHVIVANHIWQERLEGRSVRASKLTTILNFPDGQIFYRRGRQRNDGKFVLLYPGSLNYHQGLDLAIRAFARIKDEAPWAEFHIYGIGEQLPYLLQLIQDLGLQERVQYKGSQPLDQVASLMENADLGIVPKRKNGFGNEAFSTKILEFMSMGVPVLIPDTRIDSYYFNDSVVRFFRADDEISLADNMLELILDGRDRERLARNADQFIKGYLWDENEPLYLNIVDSLLGSAQKPSSPGDGKEKASNLPEKVSPLESIAERALPFAIEA